MTQTQLTQKPKSNQNWLFNFIKFAFALLIVLHHALSEVGLGAHSFYMLVEGFFFISGIFLYKTATKKKTNTFKYIGHKYLSLLPAIVVGATTAFLIVFIAQVASSPWNWRSVGIIFGKFIADLIPIQLVYFNNPDFWFLCVLFWWSFILYFLVKKAPKVMPWICLAIFLGAYLYNIIQIGCGEPWGIVSHESWWMDLWLFIRGLAGLSVGIFIAKISEIVNIKSIKKTGQYCHTVLIFLLIIGVIVISSTTYHTRFDFLSVLLLMVFCFLAHNKMSYLNANYSFDFSKYLSGVSLFIYVFHHKLVQCLGPSINSLIPSSFLRLLVVWTIVVAGGIAIYVAYYFAKKAIVKRIQTKKQANMIRNMINEVKQGEVSSPFIEEEGKILDKKPKDKEEKIPK